MKYKRHINNHSHPKKDYIESDGVSMVVKDGDIEKAIRSLSRKIRKVRAGK